MGCGESKQAVAIENTLTKSKSKAKKSENTNNNLPFEKTTANDNYDHANVNNSNAGEKYENFEKEKDNLTKRGDETERQVVDHGDNKESEAEKPADEEVVVVEENIKGEGKNDEELKGEENVVVVCNVAHEKERIDQSVVSEDVSGKSDNYSSRLKGHVSDDDEEKDAEDKTDKEKEDVLEVEEAKVLSASTDEAKPSDEENIPTVENIRKINKDIILGTANAASTIEVKAN